VVLDGELRVAMTVVRGQVAYRRAGVS
jgi:hypothetical protein